MNTGLKLQPSSYLGANRPAITQARLRGSLADHDVYVVVDIRSFPEVRLVPVDQAVLIRLCDDNILTDAGFEPTDFYQHCVGRPPDQIAWQDVPM
ncbi:MAG: hypothetical protein GF320_09305 [Armatimonadia bacterium]|nr:hypothetical protein [Armatimonadia bacterium]